METDWIHFLQRTLPACDPERIALGIGDDAAVLRNGTVITTDLLTEGVDFLLAEHDPERIGRKALAVNLSDLAAMGAVPVAVVVAVALPKHFGNIVHQSGVDKPGGDSALKNLAESLYDGMRPLLDRYGVALIGGDTNTWDGGLVLSVTAFGEPLPKGVLTRSGARSGDRILTTGAFGGSRIERQFLFEPRIREALYLHEHFEIHAAIDVSDSLSLDLSRLCEASGLGAVLEEDRIPVHPDALRWAKQCKIQMPLEHALTDGEDFELILAVPPDTAATLIATQPLLEQTGCRLSEIGVFTTEQTMQIHNTAGQTHPLHPVGFVHKSN